MLPLPSSEFLERRINRFPRFYDQNLSKNLMNILVNTEESFCSKRTSFHIGYLTCVKHFLKRIIVQKMHSFPRRYLFLKIFKSEIEEKQILSIAFAVNLSHKNETLEEHHLFKTLSRFLPGIKIIPGSFFSSLEKSDLILFCYVEIEKLRGRAFDFRDIKLLKENLSSELKQSVQSLVPSLLMPYNEEEVYKNIVQLANELKSEDDLPQAMISFQAQGQESLCFHAIIVRLKKENSALSVHLLPSSIHISMQRSIPLGSSKKEATIFFIEIDSDLFFRKNWSIDLRQARNYIVKALEEIIGPFRDYNGGLFFQQNQQLEKIKTDLKSKFDFPNVLLEEIFYGFNPPVFQALLPSSTANELFSLFISLMKKEVPKEGFVIEKKKSKDSFILIIKLSTLKSRDDFLKRLEKLSEQKDLSVGYSSVSFEGMYYLCCVNLNPTSSYLSALQNFEKSLKHLKIHKEKSKENRLLRINYQEGDIPSLNPHIGTEMYCRHVQKVLFEGLIRLNPKGVPEPAAAQEIKISSCKKIYTFTLRKHYWSNGDQVTAYDFEHTWKKALLPNANCLRSDLFYCIKGAKQARQGILPLDQVKINSLNSKTLIVELIYPASHFLHLVAHPIFFPLYKEEEEPTYFNGPFIAKEHNRDQLLHLTTNPFYWDKKNVQLQDLYISMIKDHRVAYEMFSKGELDWIGDPFTFLSPEMPSVSESKYPLKTKKVNRLYWIHLNTLSFPLQSANIRKALACAIDRKEITSELFKEYIPQISPITDNSYSELDGNRDLAQRLFELGLKELNLHRNNFPEITFHYCDLSGQENLTKMIQNQIENVLKIKLKLVKKNWDKFSHVLNKKEHQLAGHFLTSPYFYPYSCLELFRQTLHLCNESQWENSNYQTLLDLAQQAKDKKSKIHLFKKAEQILLDEMPVIAIFKSLYKYHLNPRIKKIFIAQNGDADLKWTLFK